MDEGMVRQACQHLHVRFSLSAPEARRPIPFEDQTDGRTAPDSCN
jgi:hypothetical protein